MGRPVAYRLAPLVELAQIHDVFQVSMSQQYKLDPSHAITRQPIKNGDNLGYVEKPVQILDTKIKQLRN